MLQDVGGGGIRLDIDDGAKFGVRPDEVDVGLAIAVDWAKEIVVLDNCIGARVGTLHQPTRGGAPVRMRVNKSRASTLLFRKPGFLGVWTDVFHFDEAQFWKLFGGKVVTFTWTND